jgi:molybdopterin converting factor small subunit
MQTMSVTVRVPPVLRADAGGVREVEASGATVRELLEDLVARIPALGDRIYDGSEIRTYVNVYVDGEDVRTRGGLDAPVRDGATVVLLPAMAGGNGC